MLRRASLKVESVGEGSLGDAAGIQRGDCLVEINGHPIRDIIDYRFYSADDVLDCTFLKNGRVERVRLRGEEIQNLGLDFEPIRFKRCGNRCIFCFVDQNPRGLRKSLYFKDEDYRLSFLHGNYVTLTHVKRQDLERIVEQKLSPLYVSIHATDPEIRKVLLGLNREDWFLEKVRFLVEHGIELHGQIVLCPGYNDGRVLRESLETLSLFFPKLRSVAVVPVGLTRHRRGLTELKGVDSGIAEAVLEVVQELQRGYERRWGEPFVYCSDEFYLLSREPLPSFEHYADFWQVENGVGLIRSFLTEFEKKSKAFPERLDRPKRFVLVTGVSAGSVLEESVLPRLRRIRNLDVELRVVVNRFFGESVTVSGLLTGRDILDAFRGEEDDGVLVLPPNCLNGDGLFLDDFTPADLVGELSREVIVGDDFRNLWGVG